MSSCSFWDFDRFVNRDYLGVGALIEDPSFQMSVASTLVPSYCRSHSMYRIFAGVCLSDPAAWIRTNAQRAMCGCSLEMDGR